MRIAIEQQSYVVWDGIELRPYVQPSGIDLAFLMDGPVSIQASRDFFLSKNIDVILWFSCKSGHPSFYRRREEYKGGIFIECCDAVLKEQPSIILKDAVREVNNRMHLQGINQASEVICLPKFLDLPLTDTRGHHKPVVLYRHEGCRTTIPRGVKLEFPKVATAGGVRPFYTIDHYRNGKIISQKRVGGAKA